MKKQNFLCLLMFISFSFGYSAWAVGEYPATYFSEDTPISTLEEIKKRIRDNYEEVSIRSTEVSGLPYKGAFYKGLRLQIEGMNKGIKFHQDLTYLIIHKKLLMLRYVETSECVWGDGMESGTWVKGWKCKDSNFPFSRVFSDMYVMADTDVGIWRSSRSPGDRKVEVNKDRDRVEIQTEPEYQTLGDLKKIMISKGYTWKSIFDTWSPSTSPEKYPALRIETSGPYSEDGSLTQTFLYGVTKGLLNLKEIEGEICRYVERLKKNICETIYSPTSHTPFPMILKNTLEISLPQVRDSKTKTKETTTEDAPQFSCGETRFNYMMSLRAHFEKSILLSMDEQTLEDLIKNFPEALDPRGVLFSRDDIEKFQLFFQAHFSRGLKIQRLVKNIQSGSKGSCDGVLPLINILKDLLLKKKDELKALGILLEKTPLQALNSKKISDSLSSWQVQLKDFILRDQDSDFARDYPEVYLDISVGNFMRYYETAVKRLSDPEEALTMALVHHDKYSTLLEESQVKDSKNIIKESGKKLYFGISIATGYAHHYIRSLHSFHKRNQTPFQVGEQILSINGKGADLMTYKEIDAVLLRVNEPLVIVTRRKGGKESTSILFAQPLDPLESSFSTNVLTSPRGNKILKIRIHGFYKGQAESLFRRIQVLQKSHHIQGYLLDLKSNPGGSVDAAIGVISFFVKDRVAAYYRFGSRSLTTAEPLNTIPQYFVSEEAPLVVEVSSSSKSASEIVAGSLQDLGRSITIGGKTFGKLVAQSYIPVALGNKRRLAMMITSTEYFLPNGQSLNGIGIFPDISVLPEAPFSFEDGNSEGENFVVPSPHLVEPYQTQLSKSALLEIEQSYSAENLSLEALSLRTFDIILN